MLNEYILRVKKKQDIKLLSIAIRQLLADF